MKNALISPNETPIQYIVEWTQEVPPMPVYGTLDNSCRVAEVMDAPFEVAEPLFWVECADDVVADLYYYNTSDNKIYVVPNAPYPT